MYGQVTADILDQQLMLLDQLTLHASWQKCAVPEDTITYVDFMGSQCTGHNEAL